MSQGFGRPVRGHLEKGGWQFHRHGKGDHDIWINPKTGQTIAVPVKIMSRHTANGILKQAGLDKEF
jgi:predicted RNA binding protein YcfA (HicA-like mRNA interferase family)